MVSNSNKCLGVSNNQYLGLGNASADFVRNTIVVGQNSTIVAFTFSIRTESLNAADTISAQIVRSTTCGDVLINTGVIALQLLLLVQVHL